MKNKKNWIIGITGVFVGLILRELVRIIFHF